MDKEVYKKLESLKDDFNQEIRKAFEQGKFKAKLENDIDRLISEYKQRVDGYFSAIMNGAQARNHFDEEMSRLRNSLNRELTDVTADVSSFLTRLNDSEFNKNIQTLGNDRASNEVKKDELSQNSNNKQTALESEKRLAERINTQNAERLKKDADEILEKTCRYAKALVISVSGGSVLPIFNVENMERNISNISNEINEKLGEGYINAILDYKRAAFNAYEKANQDYEHRVAKEAGLEVENSRKDAQNPFRLSDAIIEEVERVGKAPVKVKPEEEQKKNPRALRSDYLI